MTVARPFGWLLTLVAPAAIYLVMRAMHIDQHISLFTAIISISLVMWAFSLMPDFVPGLLGILLILLFGLAPNEIALSGLSSSGFLLAFSVMGLGAVITSSGLTRRYTLWLLRHLPANTFFHQFAVFLTGLLFTPIVPTITGRATIVGPVLNEIVRGWDEKTRKKSSTMVYAGGLDGINYLSPIFLTAAPANFMIFGLLPPQEQQAFQFIFWMIAASVTGMIMLILYFLFAAIFFRAYTKVKINKATIEHEWQQLGPMNWAEHVALLGILALAVGIMTASLHKIGIPQITFLVLCSLLFAGVLSREDFAQKIDWAFLLLLASMIGILATMEYLKIDEHLIEQLSWLGYLMRQDFSSFVLYLSAAILLVRLLIPLNPAILIFAAALLPLASGAGISAWLIGFVILVIAETAFFGYQSPYIFLFRNLTSKTVPYNERQVRWFHAVLIGAKLLAIYASIPFWRQLGVL